MEGIAIVPQVILLAVLLFCSAFFAGSETALMAVSRIRLRQLEGKYPKRAKTAEAILEKPEKLIGAILLGNNLVNIAMSAIATAIAISLWGDAGIIYVTVALTVIILIFGDITPKVYAKYRSDRISILVAPALRVIMTVFQPVVFVLTYIARQLLRLVGVDIARVKRPLVTEAEVKTLIDLGWEEGAITDGEKQMLARIFTLNDKTVGDIMVPRRRMATLNAADTLDQALKKIRRSGYSRFPVRRDDSREIIGFVHAKDLLGRTGSRQLASLRGVIRPGVFIPADRKIDSQLRDFRSRRLHQAVVLDKEGEVSGLVTLEDILEQMVGSIEDEYDPRPLPPPAEGTAG
jgi:putative hemolysin